MNTLKLCKCIHLSNLKFIAVHVVLFETSKGAVPASAFFNQNSIQLVGGKGAGKLKAEKSLASDRVKKEFSFIVDADDKNCLAQLTVVLKLNQGVRQWP